MFDGGIDDVLLGQHQRRTPFLPLVRPVVQVETHEVMNGKAKNFPRSVRRDEHTIMQSGKLKQEMERAKSCTAQEKIDCKQTKSTDA